MHEFAHNEFGLIYKFGSKMCEKYLTFLLQNIFILCIADVTYVTSAVQKKLYTVVTGLP